MYRLDYNDITALYAQEYGSVRLQTDFMKKLFITLSFVLIGIFSANAQTNEPVYEQVDVMPEYQGGMAEMVNFIGKNLKYPEQAVKANIIGKVIVKIIIEKDGSVNSVSFLKGIGFGCDEEVKQT